MARRFDRADGSVVFTRRLFLVMVGAGSATAAFDLTGCHPSEEEAQALGLPDLSVTILRRDDLVHLTIVFYNSVLDPSGTKIVPKGPGPRYMVVEHAPQHLFEAVLDESSPLVLPPPIDVRIAGTSRVAFQIPDAVTSIPYTVEDLLAACAAYQLSVSANALPPDAVPAQIVAPAFASSAVQGILGQAGASTVVAIPASSNIAISSNVALASSLSSAVVSSRLSRGVQRLAQSSGLPASTFKVDPAITAIVKGLSPTVPAYPTPTQTSIELPFRLLLSPNHYGQWAHATKPVSSPSGRVELWHTRLGVRDAKGNVDETGASAALRTVRALWTRDKDFDAGNPCTYLTATDASIAYEVDLKPSDRIAIVHQSSNFTPPTCNVTTHEKGSVAAGVTPQAIQINRLMLTSLGATLDSVGNWGDKALYGLSLWKHRAVMGRDDYVELQYPGVLYPFGHKAELVVITERKLHPSAPDHAYLWQRRYLVIREPVKTYPDELLQFPFTEVVVKTLSTPDLDGPVPTTSPFVPSVDGQTYRFAAEGLDREGNVVTLSIGAVWMPAPAGDASGYVAATAPLYTADVAGAALGGQRMAFAKASKPDDTTFEVVNLSLAAWDSAKPGPAPPANLGFWPVLDQADVHVEAVRHLVNAPAATAISYAEAYLENEFDSTANPGQLFAKLVSPLNLDFTHKSDSSGGFITPNLGISGLTRLAGPIGGDLANAASNVFDPSSFFAAIKAKIFGVFNLADVLERVENAAGGLLQAPRFVTQALNTIEELLQDLVQISNLKDQAKAELGSVDAALTDVADKAEKLVNDVAGISTDLDQLEKDVDNIVNTDVPDLVTALDKAAALLGTSPVPSSIAGLTAGARAQFARTLDQVKGALKDGASTLHDALRAFRMGEELLKSLAVHVEFRPTLKPFPTKDPIFVPSKPDALLLSAEVRAKDAPGKPAGLDLLCSLAKFEIDLIAPATFMKLTFDEVSFSWTSGKKPDVNVVFEGLAFDGVLSFVDKLRQLIPLSGFSDPPALSVSTEGIKASFSIALPSVAVGVFSLTNLSFSAGFHIPFIGDPLSVSFSFCTRDNPFHLTVSFLGGGGFFGIEVSPDGVVLLEAELEFGAALAVDFGVASGSVSAMAGIYFRMEMSDAQLTGYFRLRGEVDVLGIIRASIELYMELNYEFSSHKLVGRASLEIEVSIAFFSVGVTITAERKFSGGNDDPTFDDLMKPELGYDPWSEYLAAFDLAA
jgi:hypothetical protein